MINFIRRESLFGRVIEVVVARIPGFGASPEFEALQGSDLLPSIVCDALGEYLRRYYSDRVPEVDEPDRLRIAAAIEELALSRETAVEELLMYSVFEHVAESPDALRMFVDDLSPAGHALYSRWASAGGRGM